jgi:hypothetical protein
MPLIKGFGKVAVGKNIGAEVEAGKPKKQAVAIALGTARAAAKKKLGKTPGNIAGLSKPKAD